MKNKAPWLLVSGVFLFGLDQWLKWQARHAWREPGMISRFFGWSPFFNDGAAFSLPVPGSATIAITVPIVFIVGYLAGREILRPSPFFHTGRLCALILIFTGSASNLFDRIAHRAAIDYLRIFTGVINMADVLIVSGFVLYFLALRKQSRVVSE